MKVMVILKATANSEAGAMPTQELMDNMMAYNEQLVNAGIMKGGDGLKASKFGKRVRFHVGGKKSVTDGPFAETKDLVAGYWVWEVKSMDEAVEWVRKCPDPMPGEECDIEIRPYVTMEDFGEVMTPEVVAKEAELRAKVGDGYRE
jgi:hypothetical protein